MSTLRLVRSALPLLLALAAGSAAAQAPPARSAAASSAGPSAADRAAAARKYEAGAKLAKQRRWQAAYPLFMEAWSLLRHWQIALSLGRVEIELARFRAAEQHLSFALASPELPAVDRPEVTRLIARARDGQGQIRIVATSRAAAQVWLDDEHVGDAPFSRTISADPGDHLVELRSGADRETKRVTVAVGKPAEVGLELGAPGPEGAAPPTMPTPPANAPIPDSTPASPRLPLVGVGAGLTASALALGVGLTVVSLERAAELDQKGRFADNQPIENERALLLNGAIWSFIAAGVAGGGTLATLLLWPADKGKTAAGLSWQWTGPGARVEVRW